MNQQRRSLLVFGAGGVLLAPVYKALSSVAIAELSLRYHDICDNLSAPLLSIGDRLLVDSTMRTYSGEGLYLYPDWGSPRAYLVSKTVNSSGAEAVLKFQNPATGKVLWQQNLTGEDLFAARVVEHMPQVLSKSGNLAPDWQALSVPQHPQYS